MLAITTYCGDIAAPARTPSTSLSVQNAELIATPEHAFRGFVAAYSAENPEAIRGIVVLEISIRSQQ